ncbi:hypothetical protein [Streptomyces sp. NPDC014676]|uniref:hypothetical protein n=1 Tax=Streptomyces sp. NPDC014676 TaxID=3364879 RepID=UPI0036F80858
MVRALVRSEASADKAAALGAHPVRGELTEPAGWQDAAAGSDVLFHLAADAGAAVPAPRGGLADRAGTGRARER